MSSGSSGSSGSSLQRWHEEKQSAWIYRGLATCECDPTKARMFTALSAAAEEQAAILASDVERASQALPQFRPTLRARVVLATARRLGVRQTRPWLAALKVRGLSAYSRSLVSGHPMPVSASEIGRRHGRAGTGGRLRAAVFGVNDGLVSNTSLILGFAGAAASAPVIVMSGIAGWLAGAFSMAAGEYISMQSQRELFEHQIGEERSELERYPDEEAEELALIYEARGVPIEDARRMTRAMLGDKEQLLDTLAREELGLNPDDLGSGLVAALWSFIAFSVGALVPLVPFLLPTVEHRVEWAAAASAASLFVVGAVLSLFSGKNAALGGLRMLAIGAAAGAATYGIGSWLGVELS